MPNQKYSLAQINFSPCELHKKILEEYELIDIDKKEIIKTYHNLLLHCISCKELTYKKIMEIINNLCSKPCKIEYPIGWWYDSKRSKYFICDNNLHANILKNKLGECCWIKKLEQWCKDMS